MAFCYGVWALNQEFEVEDQAGMVIKWILHDENHADSDVFLERISRIKDRLFI